jgi:hypothetical protein
MDVRPGLSVSGVRGQRDVPGVLESGEVEIVLTPMA